MTARNPLWTQGGTTSAEEDRAAIRALLQSGGVLTPTDLAVTQNGTPNMSVNVAAGRVAVPGSESASLQGTYVGWLDATLNVVISAADATNARIDLIVARIKDAQYSGASNTFTVEAVTGTPSGSPAVPTAPANTVVLAQIAVAALAASIVTANITDKRIPTGARFPILTSTSLYPTAAAGAGAYRLTNDVSEGPEFCNFAGVFRPPWNIGWGEVARTKSTADQANADSTEHEITGVATAFTAVANRRYRIRFRGTFTSGTTSSQNMTLKIKDNTTLIEEGVQSRMPTDTTALTAQYSHEVETTLTAGSHTIRVTQQATNSAGITARGTIGSLIVTVDDMGPTGSPS